MFQCYCIVSVMFKDIFLQFSYVNIQFFVIFQKIGVISLITISDMKDILFLHSYDLIKDKKPKNSLKQTLFIFLLNGAINLSSNPCFYIWPQKSKVYHFRYLYQQDLKCFLDFQNFADL